MKATGIVRRIDDLGRVVIPKEIRRTLRIKEGDPLEIFIDRGGQIILKKYSPMAELGNFTQEYSEALFDALQNIVIISDRDVVIAVAGASKKEYLNKPVGEVLEECMLQRKTMFSERDGKNDLEIIKGLTEEYSSYIIVPIISAGDPIGTVVLLAKEPSFKFTETEFKIATVAASFLGRQMMQ